MITTRSSRTTWCVFHTRKIQIKWNRVKFKQTCPRSLTTSRSAKNIMSKNSTSKTRVKFKQTCPRSSTTSRSAFPFTMKAEIMILSFSNLLQNDRNIICISSSPQSEKVKKILWERFVQKEYHLCNTDENGWENYKQKYVTEVQRENSRKFNYYTQWILQEKLLKPSWVWKNDQHGKVTCL